MGAEVIVVGLGTMGAATAEALTRRGARVHGVDRWAPPHERGSHAGGSRIIRLAYAEGVAYVPLLRRSYELWHDLQARGRRRLLTPTGTLTVGRPDRPLVAGVLRSAEQHGLAHEVYDSESVAGRFPQFGLAADEVAVLDPAGGVLHPEAAVDTCLSLAEIAGARLDLDVPVTGWTATADGVAVHTSGGDIRGDRLVVCPGAGAPGLLADLEVPWQVERRLQHYWRPAVPEAFDHSRFPAWMWESGPGEVAYGLPGQDPPGGVKAAFHHANAGVGRTDPADIATGAAPASADEALPVRDWLARRLPALAEGRWVGATACLYTLTPDTDFVVGLHPAHPNVAVAAGFSGHGFKFMPVIGEILADLVLGGATEQPIELFDPARFAARGTT
jgi:sarcosine oxidase